MPIKMNLIEAIIDDNLEKTKDLILNGSCIYTPDSDLSTPLHHALLLRKFDIVDLLLIGYERDFAVLNKIDGCIKQPVYIACTEEQISQVKSISENNTISSSGSGVHESLDKVLLYSYIEPEAVLVKFTDRDLMLKQSLLKNGCYDVNAQNNDSLYYLYATATLRQVTFFNRLMKLNADYTIRIAKNTCFHAAASRGCLEIVQELLQIENLDLYSKGGDDHTPLLKAATSGNVEVFNAILDKITENKNPAEVVADILSRDKLQFIEVLQYVILHDFSDMIARLLEFGVDPEIKSGVSGYTSILWAVECNNISAVLLLARKVTDWQDPEKDYGKALEIAEQRGYNDMVDILQCYF